MVFTTGTLVDGRYSIERKLGQGGMGAVFLAKDLVLDRPVVIKHLLPELAVDAEAVGRFAREASAAVHLSCAHSVRVYGLGRIGGTIPYIVMEYLEGRDLGTVIEDEGRLAPGHAVTLILQALEGLAEAHALGIVHRDVKPQNLFVTHSTAREEVVKVLDFGLAKSTMGAGEAKLTKTAACMGSPAYMAPEQIREFATVDSRADIYAVGCCLYELLTGRPPFEADSVADVLVQALTVDPVAPRVLYADIPPALSDVVLRCLAKEASARYRDVGELARALHDATLLDAKSSRLRVERILSHRSNVAPAVPGDVLEDTTDTRTATVSDSRRERRSRRFGAIALAAISLVGIGVTVLLHPWTLRATPHVDPVVMARASVEGAVEPAAAPSATPPAIELEIEIEPVPARSGVPASTARHVRPAKKPPKTVAVPRDPGSHY